MYSDEKLNKFINFVLRYISELDIPVKRGTFIEFRSGMLNICPVGRNCSQKERDAFGLYDQEHHVREKMVEVLKKEFPEYNFVYLIGGQISFDVVPKGWDKTYCLQFLKEYDEIHFFGDKTAPVCLLFFPFSNCFRVVMIMRFFRMSELSDTLLLDLSTLLRNVNSCFSRNSS